MAMIDMTDLEGRMVLHKGRIVAAERYGRGRLYRPRAERISVRVGGRLRRLTGAVLVQVGVRLLAGRDGGPLGRGWVVRRPTPALAVSGVAAEASVRIHRGPDGALYLAWLAGSGMFDPSDMLVRIELTPDTDTSRAAPVP
jgi:hypothetical protein